LIPSLDPARLAGRAQQGAMTKLRPGTNLDQDADAAEFTV